MKRIGNAGKALAVLSAVGLAAGLAFGSPLFGQKFEEKFAKTEALAKDGKVIISNVSGTIQVKSGAQDEVRIDAVKVCGLSSEEKVRNVSGSVEASDIGGMFEGNNTSGKVILARIGGGVDCKVVSGGLQVSDVKGDVDLTTVSGSITASRIKGSIDAETSSGPISLTEISEPKTVRAKVLSGKIVYDGQILAGGKYSFESFSGSVTVTVPAASGFELEAETFSGSISTDFAVTMQGKIDRKEIRGVVNNGGAALRIKAFSGSIAIKKK